MPPPAQPTRRTHDTYNSSSTGHQRAETRGPPGWRASRNTRLQSQLTAGRSGGPRLPDTGGPNAGTYDPILDGFVTPAARERATHSVADMLRQPGTMNAVPPPSPSPPSGRERKIFAGLTIYVNGLTGTASPISDHRLKQDLAQNGAQISSHLALRTVTHVILGRPSAAGAGAGAGGGLAAGKLEREITRMRKGGVRFVDAEWATKSIEAGKRLPEAGFSNLKLAAHGQRTVLEFVRTGGGA
ncbi:hypothetical protein B0T18DRAFT_440584 [Schizothecium vesticola]|uniref:BRCT domain-containing protein n=1 Tax=Schizothecium vesticola TaxID=314040 RepID=A0AA40EKY3_9PEZI|nr:hypothetical protein B0T18DRAFT_440584 [Schizothecium vesticola]